MTRLALKRRQFLKGLLGALAMTPGAGAAVQKQPRNIIFILADDMRWDAFGRAGNSKLQTPNLNWLAETGHQFNNHFVTTSICPTSRASIYTGQYARRHGIWDFSSELSKEQIAASLPTQLRNAGYLTAFFGKWGIGQKPPSDAFNHWDGFIGQGAYFEENKAGHLTDRLSQSATEWISANRQQGNRAVFICTKAPHVQDDVDDGFLPTDRYAELYEDVVFEPSASVSTTQFDALPEFLKSSEGRRRWQYRFSTSDLYQRTVRRYHRLIKGIDDLVGDVISSLIRSGQLDQTMIVFSSDNGFLMGEHGLAGKWWGFEESIRTPLIIKLPKSEPHQSTQVNDLSLNIDIAPTLLDYAGLTAIEEMQGQSLRSRMSGVTGGFRDHFLYEHLFHHPRIAQTVGIRSHRYKYLSYPEEQIATEMFFDLASDPFETRNLATSPAHSDLLAEYRKLTKAMLEKLADIS